MISGHGNLTLEEWLQHYRPKIDDALQQQAHFVLSDFRGADVLSQEYLKDKTPHVTLCHCFEKPRYRAETFNLPAKHWHIKSGFSSDEERDVWMTVNSTGDIAWVREGREKSGTAKNIARRKL